jgi:hypothetical protein
MKSPHANIATRLFCTSLAIGAVVLAQAPDNSRANQRDRDSASQQSTQQNGTETKEDLVALQNIRKALTSDKSFSTCAHNVKITVKKMQPLSASPFALTPKRSGSNNWPKRRAHLLSVTNLK